MMPVMMASVDVDGMDAYEVSEYVTDTVIPKFERLDGIASVTAAGQIEKRLEITLDQDKIDELNDKVLEKIDTELADAQAQIRSGQKELNDQKKKLEDESETQTGQLVDAAIQISTEKSSYRMLSMQSAWIKKNCRM